MKIIQFLSVLLVSNLIVVGQTNAPALFAKASEKPKLPVVPPDQMIQKAIDEKLNRPMIVQDQRLVSLASRLVEHKEIGDFEKIINGIDLFDGFGKEMITIDTKYFGHGNARTAIDTVDLFGVNFSDDCRFSYATLIIESPGNKDNVGLFLVLNLKF